MQKWWETYYCFIILNTLTKHVLFDKHSFENYKIGAKSTWSLPTSVQRTMLVLSRFTVFQCMFDLVWNRFQVLVLRTKIKVRFRYRYQSLISFYRNKNFSFQFFSNFLMSFCFVGGFKFLKAWDWTQIFKNNQKILNIWQQIWFEGPFYDWKNTPSYW